MKPTSRHRVLVYLGKNPNSSAGQIGLGLGMSVAAVRHHLGILRSDGRVVIAGEERRDTRGRPRTCYRVSESLIGDNLAGLLDGLLRAWPDKSRTTDLNGLVAVMAAGIVEQLGTRERELPMARRIGSLLERMNTLHYKARWEAGAQGPRILFAHCPYAAIVSRHPELCKMDGLVLEDQLDATAIQIARKDVEGGTTTHCIFVMKQDFTRVGQNARQNRDT